MGNVRTIADKAYALMNAHDAEGVCGALLADNCVYRGGDPNPGTGAGARAMRGYFTAFPDIALKSSTRLNRLTPWQQRRRFTGTHTGPMQCPRGNYDRRVGK